MPLYLTISRGRRADETRPVLAVSDQRLVRCVLRQIAFLAYDDEDAGRCERVWPATPGDEDEGQHEE